MTEVEVHDKLFARSSTGCTRQYKSDMTVVEVAGKGRA